MGFERINWIEYYMDIAKVVSMRATCIRRRFGAIIVSKDNQIISTGYNGAPRGIDDCLMSESCLRNDLRIPSGERYELCKSVHAEQNAIIQASRNDMVESTMYIYGTNMADNTVAEAFPCDICRRMIINAGIEKVYISSQSGIMTSPTRIWGSHIYDVNEFASLWGRVLKYEV